MSRLPCRFTRVKAIWPKRLGMSSWVLGVLPRLNMLSKLVDSRDSCLLVRPFSCPFRPKLTTRYRNEPRSAIFLCDESELMSVINMFLELGLPFILRFISDWRAGKTTIKEAVKNVQHPLSEKGVAASSEEAEKKFLEMVEKELALPDYNLFSMSSSSSLLFRSLSSAPVRGRKPERTRKQNDKNADQQPTTPRW